MKKFSAFASFLYKYKYLFVHTYFNRNYQMVSTLLSEVRTSDDFKVNIIINFLSNVFLIIIIKGVFSKPSGKLILGPDFCLLSYLLQILATCLLFYFAELCQV